jgi:hypothetical protein
MWVSLNGLKSGQKGMEAGKAAQHSVQLTRGILRHLQAFFWLRVFLTSQAESTPTHTQLTQTVGTPLAK